MQKRTEIKVRGVIDFMIKTVTTFSTGTKVDCPKKYIDKEVYLIITNKKSGEG